MQRPAKPGQARLGIEGLSLTPSFTGRRVITATWTEAAMDR
jgi:hypothetical protein